MNRRRRHGLLARLRGHQHEESARRYLEARGLRWIASNVRSGHGELDLVMQDAHYLVFVEVRFRSHSAWGGAADSITAAKRRRLLRAADAYLAQQRWSGPCRFDVVAVDGNGAIDWIANAIEADH